MSKKTPKLKIEQGHEQIGVAFDRMEADLKEHMYRKHGEFNRPDRLADAEIDIELIFRLARVGLRTCEYYHHLNAVATVPDLLEYILGISRWLHKHKGDMNDTSVPAAQAVDNLLKGLFDEKRFPPKDV